ncbi:MAG: hypothetical protein P1U68_07220 [Verrucomicrobiales bacterium]|nr:hypothetical protein [Verrucomicrobiales bacterium]
MNKMLIKAAIAAALVLALAAGLWAFRAPIVNQVKSMRAASLLSKSEKAFAEEDYLKASTAATAAWQLQTGEIEFLRKLLPQARKLSLSELPEITLLVFLHPDTELEDQTEILEWTVSRGDAPFFHQLSGSLPAETRNLPEIRLTLAMALAQEGRTIEAIEVARALETDAEAPLSTEATLLLTAILPRLDRNPLAWKQAKDRIATLLKNEDPEISLSAWRHLRLLPLSHRDPGPEVNPVTWVSNRSDVNAADRFLASQIELYRLPPEERTKGIEAIASEYANQGDAVPLLARWFLQEGLVDHLLRIPTTEMKKTPELFTSRLQALIETSKFTEADEWLKEAPPKVPQVVTESIKAALSNKLGRKSEAISLWQRCIGRAVSLEQYQDCAAILKVAGRFGEQEIANQMARAITELPVARLPQGAALEYLETYFADRPEEWLSFWESYTRNRPGDGFAVEQVAFLKLFAEEDAAPDEVISGLTPFQQAYPQIIRFRTTIALWMLKQGRANETVEYLKGAVANWNEVSDADRAVFALALWRAGLEREGLALEQGINWNLVTPIRRNYLSSLQKTAP